MQLTDGHKKLRAYLALEGNSQTKLAAEVGVTQSAVAMWVKAGHRPAEHHREALELLGVAARADWLTKKERSALDRLRAKKSEGAEIVDHG